MAKSEALQLERARSRSLRDQQLMDIVGNPQVLGLVTLLAGLYLAQRIRFAEDDAQNNTLRGVATGGVVLMAVSRAGLSGWPALAAAGLSGVASTEGVGELDPIAKALGVKSIWSRIFG